MTKRIVDEFRTRGAVDVFGMSKTGDSSHSNAARKLLKGVRAVLASLWLVGKRISGKRVLYTTVDHGFGRFYNILVVAAARLLGYQCVIHHHTFGFCRERDRFIVLLDRMLGKSGVHVLLGEEMVESFQRLYDPVAQHVILPNMFMVPPNTCSSGQAVDCRSAVAKPFVIGHLSNLSVAKGLSEVIGTFAELRGRGVDVILRLAGPPVTKRDADIIDDARERYGKAFEYIGPVYGDRKAEFLESIDVKLLPSRSEAQPIVLIEAMASGKPVIAFARGCIPSLVGTDGGVVVDIDEDFVARASAVIQGWIDSPSEYFETCQTVTKYSQSLHKMANSSLQLFIEQMMSPHGMNAEETSNQDVTRHLDHAA
ncbi:glycosyltransferase family 4 protein [Thalassoroseus pseudoceratinae]|uniref:glycosyltransferase family 4 protein n=1 Tax=Thalassoroseus pseudoceratinae TaxID=2713176 RepID=UPI00141FD4A1|nr:glycosyltransferase family 4 protein [Thalassoroseus pseudoceratinae]